MCFDKIILHKVHLLPFPRAFNHIQPSSGQTKLQPQDCRVENHAILIMGVKGRYEAIQMIDGICVKYDILLEIDSGKFSVQILLDLSAASHVVDHKTRLDIMENWAGPSDTVLQWFKSYLSTNCGPTSWVEFPKA